MTTTTLTKEEIGKRATEIYKRSIRSQVEPEFNGKIIAIDVDTGEYEIDEDILSSTKRLKERCPNGTFFALRVGFDVVYALSGAKLRPTRS